MRLVAVGLTAVAVAWAVIIITAPRAAASPTLGPAAGLVYAASTGICHQRADRSFRSAGLQWPVCARCAGIYLSAAFGLMLGWLAAAPPASSRARWLLVLAALPTAVTWTLEVAGVMPFSNLTRAMAAVPLGGFAGWLFVGMLRYDSGLDARQIDSRRTPSLHG